MSWSLTQQYGWEMKIDKKQLVELLVEKTGMNREAVEEQLNQLVERILDAARRGKALEIKEFGMFYFDQDGNLKFDVADELSTEISFRYAGMSPLELKPERDPSIVITEEKSSIEENTDSDDSSEKVVPPVPPVGAKAKEADEPSKKPHKPMVKKAEKEQSKGPLLILAVIVILILAGLLYLWLADSGESVPDPVITEEQAPVVPESDPIIVIEEEEADTVEQQQVVEPEQTERTVVSEEGDYGFRGSARTLQGDVFSVVVHSMSNETAARTTADQFTAQGYRSFVTTRVIGGNETWRVSIGQFPTIDAAVSAATELPSPYNQQNFIQRLQ